MALTLDDLFASPDHYLHSFDGDAAIFMPMDRASYHRSIFLDRRISPAASGVMRIPVAALACTPRRPQPTGWIFHVAHCGSTLLARALDQPSANLVLREPLALRQVALAPDEARLRLVAAMLGKRYRADAVTIVKANVPVNFLMPRLAAIDPDAPAIMLYLGLRDYLLAILRSDNHRTWLRNVTAQLFAHLGDLSACDDAERAAALWLAQRRAFVASLETMARARSLDAETFFAAPSPVLAAAVAHFGVPLSDEAIAALVGGPLFATHSKNPELAFDGEARRARRGAFEAALGPELARALAWIERETGQADPFGGALRSRALVDPRAGSA